MPSDPHASMPRLQGPSSEVSSSSSHPQGGPLIDAPAPPSLSASAFDGPDAEDLLADMGFESMAKLEMPPELKKGPAKMGPAVKTLTPSKFESHVEHVKRPAYTKVGKEVILRVNSHRVEKYPAGDVWQYDVGVPFLLKHCVLTCETRS